MSTTAMKVTGYSVLLFHSPEDEGWIANIPALAACSAFGETRDAALREIQSAADLWMEAALAAGRSLPPPDDAR